MEALSGPPRNPIPRFEPNTDKIKRRLLKHSVEPTPKIIHTLRKKEIQKHNRRQKRLAAESPVPPLTPSQSRALAAEEAFRTLRREYRDFNRALSANRKPWETPGATLGFEETSAEGSLRREELAELREMFENRRREELRWVLDDDVEAKEEWLSGENQRWEPPKRRRSEGEVIRFLVDRISGTRLSKRDWKLTRMMKQSGLEFTERQLLQIVTKLGFKEDCWQKALSFVECVYVDKQRKLNKSRFVYTKLLAILGKARKPEEALKVFNTMLADRHIYPDMAAYHSIAVTLGQAGQIKDLIKVMECMRQKPSKRTNNSHVKDRQPLLEPDIVVYNAVLNACVPTHQWKGVSWVFKQLRASGLNPNGATYGLAMEVMLQSGKYDLVHEYFRKMRKKGETPKAITYKVLVKAFSSEGKVNEAIGAVREMEQRGVVGASCVYYELACCLCANGRWEEALLEVEKMKKLSDARPLEVTFTGMITSSMHSGHINDCLSIFEQMKIHCSPNIGTLNVMLKVYGRNDMFSKAKAMFEEIRRNNFSSSDDCTKVIVPDEFTYNSMLEASANALQWEYFENVYREMVLSGYQLDQNKYSSLLVEASQAGKSHLLEHAYDAILKAGEIPNPQYFTEMLLQAMAHHDEHKCVTLLNTMALAPFQLSELQWKDIFKNNTDRISQNHLEQLSDSLDKCEIRSEATVVNLSRALNSLKKDIPISCDDKPLLDRENEISELHTEQWVDEEDSDSDEDIVFYSPEMCYLASSGETSSGKMDFDCAEDEDSDVDDTGFETLLNFADESPKSDLPSAQEILEAWKES